MIGRKWGKKSFLSDANSARTEQASSNLTTRCGELSKRSTRIADGQTPGSILKAGKLRNRPKIGSKKTAFVSGQYPKNASEIFDATSARGSPQGVLGGCSVRSGVPGPVWWGRGVKIPVFPYLSQWAHSTLVMKILMTKDPTGRIGWKFFQMIFEYQRTIHVRRFLK